MDITTVLFTVSTGLVGFCFVLFFVVSVEGLPLICSYFSTSATLLALFLVMGFFEIASHEQFSGLLTSILLTLALE
jgi:hypothetical protein